MGDHDELRIVIVAPVGRDALAMATILEERGLPSTICADLADCGRTLAAGAGCLLLTEEGLGTDGADELVAVVERQPSWSAPPVVVLISGDAGERIELLQRLGLSLGAVTLLDRPLSSTTLVSAVQAAVSARRRQYEVRNLLRERAAQAKALRASEARFREMADAAPAILWETDARSVTTFLSRGWYDFTGMAPDSGLGDGWLAPIHADDHDQVERTFRESVAARQPFQIEYRLRAAAGIYRWVLDVARPRLGADGALLGYVGSVIDIQERRLAERDTERNRALLDAVLESLPVGVVITDPKGRLIRWNKAHEQLWGLDQTAPRDSRDMTTFGDWSAWWPDTGKRLAADERAFARALLRREAVPGQLVEIERFDDRSRRFLIVGAAPVLDADGELIAAVAAQTDVTESVRLQRALREADRRKDEFLATLAHELRNPLAPISTAVELLKRSQADGNVLETCVTIVERQVKDLTRLVDDLLEVSRITRGKLELRLEPVTVRETLDRAIEAARPLMEAAGHELTIDLADGDAWVRADPTRLTQVFTNLLNNAARYTPPAGAIRVTSSVVDDQVRVAVRDNGVGIAAEHLSTVFEMFSQVAPALERSGEGLGVGLALAKGLVDLHGGSIEARSDGLGLGSEFSVALPHIEVPASPSAQQEAAPTDSERQRVLVVDDNRDAADAMAMALEMVGHDVRIAYDGKGAIAEAEQHLPEVVLLDIGLPDLTGYDVAQRLRALPGGRDLLIVAQTGWGQEQDKRRSREAGFDHHLTKPVDLASVLRLLERTPA